MNEFDIDNQTKKIVLQEYENVLLNNTNSISKQLFPESPILAEQIAFSLIKIVVEKFLNWSPQEVYLNFTPQVAEKMRLTDVIKKIQFPPEVMVDDEPEYSYIAAKLYPDELAFSFRETVIDLYKRLLANQYGEINEKDTKEVKELKKELMIDPYFKRTKESNRARYKFPKGYMTGTVGRKRASLCLQYMIMTFYSFHSVDEMYAYFAKTQQATTALKKYRLYTIYVSLFDTPLDFLHFSLPDDQKNELLYNYYKYINMSSKHDSKKELRNLYKKFLENYA